MFYYLVFNNECIGYEKYCNDFYLSFFCDM